MLFLPEQINTSGVGAGLHDNSYSDIDATNTGRNNVSLNQKSMMSNKNADMLKAILKNS